MPPQSSDERQNVSVIDRPLTFAIFILVALPCLCISFLWIGYKESYKVQYYKQGTCTVEIATVFSTYTGKQWKWVAEWTVLLKTSNSSPISVTFIEKSPDMSKKQSTALEFIAQRQVNSTYPCFYDGQISPNSFKHRTEDVQWDEPTKENAQKFFYLGIIFIALSVLPSLYILWRVRLKNCAKRRSGL